MNAETASDGAPPPVHDAGLRLAAFVVYVAAVMFAVTSIPAMAALVAYVLVAHAAAGRRAGELVADARRLSVFVALVVVFNGWAAPGEAVVSIAGHAVFTREGLLSGVFFSLRLVALYLAMALLVRSTLPEEFAAGVCGALRPVSSRLAERMAFFGFMTMSFVPLFSSEIERIRLAQSFRGGAFAGSFTDRVRSARTLVVPLVLSAVHRSAQLAAVAELRGLEARFARFARARPGAGPGAVDVIVLLLTVAVVAAAAWWLD